MRKEVETTQHSKPDDRLSKQKVDEGKLKDKQGTMDLALLFELITTIYRSKKKQIY